MTRYEELTSKLESGFLGFWIKQYRISYLIVAAIVIMGIIAVVNIPKESSPAIKLGIISISTSYFGANPVDIDALVTDKIYKEVKDIKGVDKIESTSRLGFSNVILTLETDAYTNDVLSDVRSSVARVKLPTDAKTPVITEIETDTNRAFSVYLYSQDRGISRALLYDRAVTLKNEIERVRGINDVILAAGGDGGPADSSGGNESIYDIEIIFPREKLDTLNLSLSSISQTIQGFNKDQPIGNFSIGEKKYDFRIEGKKETSLQFLETPIPIPSGGTIRLGEIATIERRYKNESERFLVLGGAYSGSNICDHSSTGAMIDTCPAKSYPYVGFTVNKIDNANIFSASDLAKAKIKEVMQSPDFVGFDTVYAIDLAENIRSDYKNLSEEALSTISLVFIAMFFFVGWRASLFATITLPIAFLCTFILLYSAGYTMNFLTNFALILSFGTTVDTIIVLVQASDAKIRAGYNPRTAIMLAIKEYGAPIISGALTTIIVFIPLMVLPGILGKFLAYIPITNFGVQAAGLVLALTVNSAIYLLFVRKKNSYIDDPTATEYTGNEGKELLELERVNKIPQSVESLGIRIKMLSYLANKYKGILRILLENTIFRRLSIILPVVLLFLSFIFLAPRVGFDLFPGDDNAYSSFIITGPIGQKTEVMLRDFQGIEGIFSGYPEIEYTNITMNGNSASIAIQLTKREIRKKEGQRSVFEIVDRISEDLSRYESKGYKVSSQIQENGPPSAKPIGLKLIVDNPEKLPLLIDVAKEFENYLKTLPGTRNIGRSSVDTPGQVVFELNKELLVDLRISAAQIYSTIQENMNGVTVGSIEDNGEDMSIILKSDQFTGDIDLNNIFSLQIPTQGKVYRVGDFIKSNITNATALISREDGDILITVDADLEEGGDSVATQNKVLAFAASYNFPSGITYKAGGENEENRELIVAVLSAFFLSLIAIFAILTFQFSSYSQPLVILYSVIMALPVVMIGLLITDNSFSLPFGIGFVAFTGIGVNFGVVLISAINENIQKGMHGINALIEAGGSRLEPVLLTTLTTVLGTLPISLRDKFWSGLGFTIIFGVIGTTILTLFVIKSIYYELYIKKHSSLISRVSVGFHKIFSKTRKLK